jgi:hypothetical protein
MAADAFASDFFNDRGVQAEFQVRNNACIALWEHSTYRATSL